MKEPCENRAKSRRNSVYFVVNVKNNCYLCTIFTQIIKKYVYTY